MNYWLISAKALYTWHRGVESILQPSCLPTLINLLLPSSFPFLPFPMPFFGRTETEPLFSPSHIHFSVLFLPSSFFIIFFFISIPSHITPRFSLSPFSFSPFLKASYLLPDTRSSPKTRLYVDVKVLEFSHASIRARNSTLRLRIKVAHVRSCNHKGRKYVLLEGTGTG